MILSAEVDCKHCQHSKYHCIFSMKITKIMNVTNVQLCMIYALNRQELAKNSPTLTKPSHAKVMPLLMNSTDWQEYTILASSVCFILCLMV